jgi:hypothetical protein
LTRTGVDGTGSFVAVSSGDSDAEAVSCVGDVAGVAESACTLSVLFADSLSVASERVDVCVRAERVGVGHVADGVG